MVLAAPLLDSSSGCAWIAISRSGGEEGDTAVTLEVADNGGVTESHEPAATTSQQTADLLEARYGTGRPRSVLLVVTLGVMITLFVGWVLWAAVLQADQDVRWRTVGYSKVSDTSVTLDFDVFKPADTDVVCVVRALDSASVEVGRAEVPVTSQENDTHVVYTLQVTARPNTAEVAECQLDQ
jgi:hypothetical protein